MHRTPHPHTVPLSPHIANQIDYRLPSSPETLANRPSVRDDALLSYTDRIGLVSRNIVFKCAPSVLRSPLPNPLTDAPEIDDHVIGRHFFDCFRKNETPVEVWAWPARDLTDHN